MFKSAALRLGLLLSLTGAQVLMATGTVWAAPEVILDRPAAASPGVPQEKLAVLDLEVKGDLRPEVASILTDRLRVLFLQQSGFQIMERSQMTAILKEQGFQSSMLDCTSTECALELGKLLSVRYLLVGSASRLGQIHTLNARLIDAQSGQIIRERFVDCRCSLEELLTDQTPRLVAQLTTSAQASTAVQPASLKDPLTAGLLNLPLPLGYMYLEEWGWMGAMLAIDLIAVVALLANNWAWPGADAMAWLVLGATRIFGVFHAPGLANDRNAAVLRAHQPGLSDERQAALRVVPLLAWHWQF